MDELEQLQETILREIQRTEKAMDDMNLREDTDRGMPRIDALNWVLNEILVLKREEEIQSFSIIHYIIFINVNWIFFQNYVGRGTVKI
jgi:hypothetical protein